MTPEPLQGGLQPQGCRAGGHSTPLPGPKFLNKAVGSPHAQAQAQGQSATRPAYHSRHQGAAERPGGRSLQSGLLPAEVAGWGTWERTTRQEAGTGEKGAHVSLSPWPGPEKGEME